MDAEESLDNATPLMRAAGMARVPIINALLDMGANINYQDKDKWTPLQWAINNHQWAVVELLIKRGADRTPLVAREKNSPDY